MVASEWLDDAATSWVYGSRGGALIMQIRTILAAGSSWMMMIDVIMVDDDDDDRSVND